MTMMDNIGCWQLTRKKFQPTRTERLSSTKCICMKGIQLLNIDWLHVGKVKGYTQPIWRKFALQSGCFSKALYLTIEFLSYKYTLY